MKSSMHRVAVTGASGYIGTRLTECLERMESVERILAIDVRPLSIQSTRKVMFLQQDVTKPLADLFSEHRIDTVVDLAFILNPGHDRAASRRVNVGAISNVLDACVEAKVQQFLYLSSSTVYGAHPDNSSLLTEESPVRPVKGFQYGEDKAEAEKIIALFVKEQPSMIATVLRACPVMGPNADNFVSRAFNRSFLVGIGGHDPFMQLLHEDDLTDVVLLCLENRVPGVYNLGGETTVRWSDMADMSDSKFVKLPGWILYGLVGLTWSLRLQHDSPLHGLDFIKYSWTVCTDKIKRDLGVDLRYSTKETWKAFVKRRNEEQISMDQPEIR